MQRELKRSRFSISKILALGSVSSNEVVRILSITVIVFFSVG